MLEGDRLCGSPPIGDDTRMMHLRFLLPGVLIAGILGCNDTAPRAGVATPPAAVEPAAAPAGRFVSLRDQIFVPVLISGRQTWALLDTGASASAVDAALADELALPAAGMSQVTGTAGAFETRQVRVESLVWWGVRAAEITVPSYGLGNIAGPEGQPVGVILGFDVLRAFAVDIDFAHAWITLQPRVALDAPSVPMDLATGIPAIEIEIDGSLRCTMRIDTGASLFDTEDVYVNVVQATLDRLRAARGDMQPSGRLGATDAGGAAVELAVYDAASLSLGPFTFARPHLIVQPPAGYFASPDAVGFIGNNLLEKCGRVVIDYPAARLRFIGTPVGN